MHAECAGTSYEMRAHAPGLALRCMQNAPGLALSQKRAFALRLVFRSMHLPSDWLSDARICPQTSSQMHAECAGTSYEMRAHAPGLALRCIAHAPGLALRSVHLSSDWLSEACI